MTERWNAHSPTFTIVILWMSKVARQAPPSRQIRGPCGELISDLVARGAGINGRTGRGITPVLLAAEFGNATVMWHLYRLGAQMDVTATDDT